MSPGRSAGAGPFRDAFNAVTGLLERPLASYYLLVGATALLTALGLVMVLSASSVTSFRRSGSPFVYFEKQAMWVAIGLPLLWLASRLPVRTYRALAYPLLLGSAVLLCLVLVPGIGISVAGNQNWIDAGGLFRVQPSEPAKLALILWSADLLARKRELLKHWKHLLIPLVPVAFCMVGLVILGNDLGTALIVIAILLTILWVAGAPARLFAGTSAVLAVVVFVLIRLEPYRVDRVRTFLDPFSDIQGVGYQPAHGIYALAGGGWWGVGLGASREKWGSLPAAHTDFIFAIIGEELGLIGTFFVLGLFATIGFVGLRIAARTGHPFIRLAAAGATGWIMVQAVVNIGSVLTVLPVTGIPLPLVSYGGSALLPTMAALGMLVSFTRREPSVRAALAARGPGLFRARRGAQGRSPGSVRAGRSDRREE